MEWRHIFGSSFDTKGKHSWNLAIAIMIPGAPRAGQSNGMFHLPQGEII
jgi:hypothetical protein